MKPLPTQPLQAPAEEYWLDAESVCRLTGVDQAWLGERITQGLLTVVTRGPGDAWRFDAVALRRVQRLHGLERDFGAVPELAALVADLEDELRNLRRRQRG